MHHSKSLSFMFKKATGKELPDTLLVDLGKFANLIRVEVIKDSKSQPIPTKGNDTDTGEGK